MLTQEECVNLTMSRAGQFILGPEDVDFTPAKISRDFFIPAVMEYQKYRPPMQRPRVLITNGLMTLPADFMTAVGLEPIQLYQGVVLPFLKLPSFRWQINPQRNQLEAPAGDYVFEYLSRFMLSSAMEDLEVYPSGGEGEIGFQLGSIPKPKTLVVTGGALSAEADVNGVITGDLVDSGNLTSVGAVTLVLKDPVASVLTATYTTLVPYCKELSLQDRLFLDLFEAKFLTAFASAKAQLKVEGVPVDVNLDELLSYARQKDADVRASLTTDQKWWLWGSS